MLRKLARQGAGWHTCASRQERLWGQESGSQFPDTEKATLLSLTLSWPKKSECPHHTALQHVCPLEHLFFKKMASSKAKPGAHKHCQVLGQHKFEDTLGYIMRYFGKECNGRTRTMHHCGGKENHKHSDSGHHGYARKCQETREHIHSKSVYVGRRMKSCQILGTRSEQGHFTRTGKTAGVK